MSPRTFEMSRNETKNADRFVADHSHPDANRGAIGGGVSFTVTSTSLGNMWSATCSICKARDFLSKDEDF